MKASEKDTSLDEIILHLKSHRNSLKISLF